MKKEEWQKTHEIYGEDFERVDFCWKFFGGKITKVRKGTFYDEEISTRNKRIPAPKKSKFSSENKDGSSWDVFYNKG